MESLHSLTQSSPILNEFYKKGCQEKTPPRPEWRFFLEIQPTVVSLLWRSLACCPCSCVSLLMVTMPSSLRERQASWLLRRQPWFYPRLVAYGYFWLSERA